MPSNGEAVLTARRRLGTRIEHVGLPDGVPDADTLPTLHDRDGIATAAIVARVKAWL